MDYLLTLSITPQSSASVTGSLRNTVYVPELQRHIEVPFWYSEIPVVLNGEKYILKMEKFIVVRENATIAADKI